MRVAGDDRAARIAMLDTICDSLSCAAAGHVGKTLILYRHGSQNRRWEQKVEEPVERSRRLPNEPHTPKKLLAAGKTLKDRKTHRKAARGNDELVGTPARKPHGPQRRVPAAPRRMASPDARAAPVAARWPAHYSGASHRASRRQITTYGQTKKEAAGLFSAAFFAAIGISALLSDRFRFVPYDTRECCITICSLLVLNRDNFKLFLAGRHSNDDYIAFGLAN
ncbi:CRS1/YhbY domain-containing protein [Advenella kashmirensis WT001]|uniref:CRS1/YhbY domain-containing protein n=1 Tax=Advenella kashmirensis (strain DSM 17095 / LMG 22695 / WT001) TaxID=1036672 RepID=I3UAM7_ADVKW|nr:CRS1/YhbY domain-containing protein [Advenella kashmirensis WT001]